MKFLELIHRNTFDHQLVQVEDGSVECGTIPIWNLIKSLDIAQCNGHILYELGLFLTPRSNRAFELARDTNRKKEEVCNEPMFH